MLKRVFELKDGKQRGLKVLWAVLRALAGADFLLMELEWAVLGEEESTIMACPAEDKALC